jgi:hypothetical protein
MQSAAECESMRHCRHQCTINGPYRSTGSPHAAPSRCRVRSSRLEQVAWLKDSACMRPM